MLPSELQDETIPDPPMPSPWQQVAAEQRGGVGNVSQSAEVREKLLRIQEIQTELGRIAPQLWELVGPPGQWRRVRRWVVPAVLLGCAIWPGVLGVSAVAVRDREAAGVLGTLTLLLGGCGAGLAVLAWIELRRRSGGIRALEERASVLASEEEALRAELLSGAEGPQVVISSAERIGRVESELEAVRAALEGYARGFVGASASSRQLLLERERSLVEELAELEEAAPGSAHSRERQPEWYVQMMHDRLPIGPSPRIALARLGPDAARWRVWFHRHVGWGLGSASGLAVVLLVAVRIAHHLG